MDFEEYKKIYFDTTFSIDRILLTAIVSSAMMDDFPKNLSTKIGNEIKNVLNNLTTGIKIMINSKESKISKEEYDNLLPVLDHSDFISKMSFRFFSNALRTDNLDRIVHDFHTLIYPQAIVMGYAYLDAFMGDSVRAICYNEIRVLRRNKQMTWDEILTLGDWDTLVEKMVGDNCYEFGMMSLEKRIIMLIEKYGLSDWTQANICAELIFNEYLRHIIIHNGGRASREFINKTKRKDIKIGDMVPIMEEDVLSIMACMQLLISDLFRAITTKFFKRDEREINELCIYEIGKKS